MELKNPLYITLIIYLVLIGVIVYTRPNFLYINDSNRLKVFGTGSKTNKTIFPLWLVLLISMVIVYSFLCILLD